MRPPGYLLLALTLILLAIPVPAMAALVLSQAVLTPQNLPLTPGQELRLDAAIAIIPSGARTFSTGHSLQLETDLADGSWNTVVVVDGIPADREAGQGRVFFVPGFVLSYYTYRDVALNVTVEGTVPWGTGPDIMVLRILELDDSGLPVPGSEVTVTEQVSSPATSPATATVPGTAAPPPSSSPAPTKASGFSLLPATAVAGAGAAANCRRHRRDSGR